MKLYYSKGACSLAIRIAIHEIGISCQFESVNLKTKQTETGADFFSVNPRGSVPTLLLDDKTLLTENIAIQQYLADTNHATELLPPIGDFKRYRVLEWLSFISTELHKTCAPLFNPAFSTHAETKALFLETLKNKLQFTNDHLQQKYITGNLFTSADCFLFVVLSWLSHIGVSLADYSNLERYFSEVKTRKAVAKSLAEENIHL